jgi:hypothetical protein
MFLRPKRMRPKNPKEINMQYKTIIHELLQQRPQMHEQLRKDRKLLPTMELYAKELKRSHEAWKEQLSQQRPDSDPSQVASEALPLDRAMAFLHRRTSRD